MEVKIVELEFKKNIRALNGNPDNCKLFGSQ